MPAYDYICASCSSAKEFERNVKMAERNEVRCPVCNRLARRVYKAPAGHTFKPFLCENFGLEPVMVESRRQFVEENKRRGLPVIM